MTYHIIIDTGNSMIERHDNSDSINGSAKRIKSVELIFLEEEIPNSTIIKNTKQLFGSNLFINPRTREPFYPIFSIPLLDAISLAIGKIGIVHKPNSEGLPTTAIVITLSNDCNNDISEFDSVVAAARKIKSNDGMDKWVFRTFHPSIDTVSIASEKTNTNHFVTMFEKGELDSKNMNDLNNEVFKFYRKTS